jgi:DNA-directed RNA polymerase specialized sigma24 family protein
MAWLEAAAPMVEEFERQRARLFAIAYRMLGSASEAEDVLQEAFGYQEGR